MSRFTLTDFNRLFSPRGFVLTEVFGDYDLDTYSHQDSPRLIMIMEKSV